MLVDVIPELVEEPVPTSTTGDDGDTEYMSPLVWQAVLGNGLSMKEEVVPSVDCYDSLVGEPTSAYLDSAGGFVDLAGGDTVGVTSPANLVRGITVGVTSLADAVVASLANAEVRPRPMMGWRRVLTSFSQVYASVLYQDCAPKLNLHLIYQLSDLVNCFKPLCGIGGYDVSSICAHPGLFDQGLLAPALFNGDIGCRKCSL